MVDNLGRINIIIYEHDGNQNIAYTNHPDQKIGSVEPWELSLGDTFAPPENSEIIYHSSLSGNNFVREMKHLENRYELENPNSTFSEYVLNLLIKPKKGELISIKKTLPVGPLRTDLPRVYEIPDLPSTLEDICSSCPFR